MMEGTKRGSILSTVAVFTMATLFYLETRAFFSSSIVTDLALDGNKEPRIRVNFNITMMDLKCDFAVVDVVSVLGTEQNVTQHVTKWGIDAEGVRQRFAGRNKKQNDIILFDEDIEETIEELHEDGEDAISLDDTTLRFARNENEYLFVDFYASWCSHCRDLAPTWETLAEVMDVTAEEIVDEALDELDEEHEYTDEDYAAAKKVELPVMIAKVDCVDHKQLCMEQQIRAYPTLRLFIDGEPYKGGDYTGDRTVVSFTNYLATVEEEHKKGREDEKTVDKAHEVAKERMEISEEEREWSEKLKRQRKKIQNPSWKDDEHPGCQISGFLMVDRVPGNFRIQARSPSHDLAAHMTNVSHEIHHLSFGEPIIQKRLERSGAIPNGVLESFSPMDGNAYVAHNLHEAHHHYLKVVTTNFENPNMEGTRHILGAEMRGYQILQSSQLSYYRSDIVPEAKFTYDLSPISVSYRESSRRWYDYLTSVMAIVGGSFTVVGMFESSIYAMTSKKQR